MNKKYGFYFIALMNDWRYVIKPQLQKIINSELFQNTDTLFVHIFYTNFEDLANIMAFLNQFKKIKIEYSSNNNYEFPILNKIKELSKIENFYCWYIHSKGVSITDDNKLFYHGSTDLKHLQECVRDWREYMEYFLIDRYDTCIENLTKGYDACGVQLSPAQNPAYQAFSGNFWWSKSEYIKTLPDINELNLNNRWNAESWIGMGMGALLNLHSNNAGYCERIIEDYTI